MLLSAIFLSGLLLWAVLAAGSLRPGTAATTQKPLNSDAGSSGGTDGIAEGVKFKADAAKMLKGHGAKAGHGQAVLGVHGKGGRCTGTGEGCKA